MGRAMEQPQYNKELDVRILGAEDLPRARQVAGRAFNEYCEDWFSAETTLGGFDREGTLVSALDYQPESLWWGPAQIPAPGHTPRAHGSTVRRRPTGQRASARPRVPPAAWFPGCR